MVGFSNTSTESNFTYRTDGIRQKTSDTAEERGIQSGTWVPTDLAAGQVRVRALVTDRVQGRELYIPMRVS
jgi:formate dehydrogenase major subunit